MGLGESKYLTRIRPGRTAWERMVGTVLYSGSGSRQSPVWQSGWMDGGKDKTESMHALGQGLG